MRTKGSGRAKAKRPSSRVARSTKPVKPTADGSRRAGGPPARPAAAAEGPRLVVRMIAESAPYAEVLIGEPVTEASMERLFDQARGELLRYRPRRVLVDLHDAELRLSISDLNGLAKLIGGSFLGLVDRLAIVLRADDVPREKFFEPSMIHRGMPTYVSADRNDAVEWLTAKQWPRGS